MVTGVYETSEYERCKGSMSDALGLHGARPGASCICTMGLQVSTRDQINIKFLSQI